MRRREFVAGLGAPLLLSLRPNGCARPRAAAGRRRPALALATADTESHVAVLNAITGRVRARVATVEEPRSIEWAGGSRAVVAHTTSGAVTLLEGVPVRVRRVLRGMAEPRYTAIAPDGSHAYVTDSARGEVVVMDLERGRVVGGAEVGALARHLTIAPDGRTLWVALGTRAAAVAVVDLSEPRRPRVRGVLRPPFLAHDVACSPGGRRLWITSGDRDRLALYLPGRTRPIAVLPAGAPPQHVSFGGGRAYVASGDDGSLAAQRIGDGHALRRVAVAKGSYNVQHGAGRVVTPSLDDGTVTIVAEGGRVIARTRIAPAAHDACLLWA
jgi:DNA-binding beta-propeller fold protein YncE